MKNLMSKLRAHGFDVTFDGDKCVLRRYTGSDENVTIPEEVDIIGNNAFYGKNVRSVKFGSNITHIQSSAFERCANLTEISPLASVEVIESYAFAYAIKLTAVELSDKLTYIGECAFNGSGLEKITIPGSVKNVDYKAFFACHGLKEAYIDGDDAIYGESCFANCRKLGYLSVGKGVSSLERRAFSYCKNLKHVKLHKNTGIGEDAFEAVNSEAIMFED
ncbi:MAG: hypothetical protein E7218_06695 [Anaerofustis stercorihominis]|nr:hypothetical protein [Anaerofustis stercorihominis]